MTRDDLYTYLFASPMFQEWHWFRWHFEHKLRGKGHPFADAVINACSDCETILPGTARHFLGAIAQIRGMEKHLPHWEQLLQRLAELLIVRQVLQYPWPAGTTFILEPSAGKQKKNPEIAVITPEYYVAIEVKAPAIFEHINARATNAVQLPARALPKEFASKIPGANQGLTLPQDNPIKDFLVSAEAKFAQLRTSVHEKFYGLLVIIWDDFIYEPIGALTHPTCGLFTEHSFAKDASGQPQKFQNIDGVVVVRHLHQFIRACRDEPLVDGCRQVLDYGQQGTFPFKAYIQNPSGATLPEDICECLQALPPNPMMGAEYVSTDIIWWLDPREGA